MKLNDFLKSKVNDQAKELKKRKSDFVEKCKELLASIKLYDEEKYKELNNIFHSKYCRQNIQKKLIQGFYSQLLQELNRLKQESGELIQKATKKVAAYDKLARIQQLAKEKWEQAQEIKEDLKTLGQEKIEKVTKEVHKEVKEVKEKVIKAALEATHKKVKKVQKKSPQKTVKKVAKKAVASTQKNAKKVVKKVAKKSSRPVPVKKTAKKNSKKNSKKK